MTSFVQYGAKYNIRNMDNRFPKTEVSTYGSKKRLFFSCEFSFFEKGLARLLFIEYEVRDQKQPQTHDGFANKGGTSE